MNLKERAKQLEPIVRIGKNGITENLIQEIQKVLRTKGLIKIKFLTAALGNKDKKEMAAEIASKTGAELIDVVGFVAVLYKRENLNTKKRM